MPVSLIGAVTALLEPSLSAVLASPAGRVELALLAVVVLVASLFESM